VGRGVPAAARPPGRRAAASDRHVESRGLRQRGDRPEAPLRAALGRTQAPSHPGPPGGGDPVMNAALQTGYERLGAALAQCVDEACERFEAAWRAGQHPVIEAYLGGVPEPGRLVLVRELILFEVASRRRGGEGPRLVDYRDRFPDLEEDWLA